MCPDGEGEWVAAMVCGCSLVTQVHSVGRTTDGRDVGRTDSHFVCSFSVKSAAGGLCHQVQPSLAWCCRQPDSPSVRPSTGLSVCSFASRLPVSSSMLTNKSDDNKLKGSDCCDWPGNIKGMPPLLCARHGEAFVWLLDSTKCPANGCPSVSHSDGRLVV